MDLAILLGMANPIQSTQSVTANLAHNIRYATLNNHQHLVAPITLIVPGVLNGSKGPLYYPADEVLKSTDTWNYVPLVVYHPKLNGIPVSARTPQTLNDFCVGVLLNTKFKDGKLQAEGWFDVEASDRIDSRVLANILDSRPIEVSTGLRTENEQAPEGSTFDGTAYTQIARNYRPDHLAILPDEVGACSLVDGCGVLANTKNKMKKVQEYIENQPSHTELFQKLEMLLEERFGVGVLFIQDVFNKNVIYSKEGKLWQLGYKTDLRSDDNITLSAGMPVEVKRTIKYKTVTNRKENTMTEKQKQAIIDGLIANECCYEEVDREALNSLSEKALESLQKQTDQIGIQETEIRNVSKDWDDELGNKHVLNQQTNKWETVVADKKEKEEVVVNEKPKTTEDWLKEAPTDIQAVVQNAMDLEEAEKKDLIKQLTVNISDEQKPALVETLNGESLKKLRTLKLLAPIVKEEPKTSYIGQAVPTSNQSPENDASDDILELPTINFENKE